MAGEGRLFFVGGGGGERCSFDSSFTFILSSSDFVLSILRFLFPFIYGLRKDFYSFLDFYSFTR